MSYVIKGLKILTPPRPIRRREGLEIEFNHLTSNLVRHAYKIKYYIKV
jgi:hypothetical protein